MEGAIAGPAKHGLVEHWWRTLAVERPFNLSLAGVRGSGSAVETDLVSCARFRSGVAFTVLRRFRYNSIPRYRIAAANQAANTPIGYAMPRGYLNASAAIAASIAPAISAMFASTGSRTRVLATAAVTVLPTRTAPAATRPPLPPPLVAGP